jgi:hypothetical protein
MFGFVLANLPAATVAGIFGIAGAAVLVMYILKLRRRVIAVPFSPLWKRILKDKEATSLFSKLKRIYSLLLQLLLLALLVLALGNPRLAESIRKGRTMVVLVDASASMQSTDVAPSRLESAKGEVKKLIRALGGADSMLIAQMDATVTPLGPMTDDTSELERDLDQIRPTETRADFARAIRFADDTLHQANVEDGHIVIVSDGQLGSDFDEWGAPKIGDWCKKVENNAKWGCISYVPIGKEQDNVAVTQFSVRRYPLDKSRYEVMLGLTDTGPTDQEVELSLLGDGQLVDLTRLHLKAGEHLNRFYPNLSGASRTLEAKIAPLEGSKDYLPADDHAYALLPERRRAKVLVVTEGNTYLEAALLLDEYLDVTDVTPTKYPEVEGTAKWDVVIFDDATPEHMPNAHCLYLNPLGPGSPVKVGDKLEADKKKGTDAPGFDKLDRKHPVIRYTALDDVNIAVAHELSPEPGDKVVGAANNGAAPILIAGTRNGNHFVALGFDVRDSDLPLRIAWPLFLLDSINWFMDEDSKYLSSYRTGEVWRVPVAGASESAELTLPDNTKQTVPIHEGRAVYLGERAGFYELDTGTASTDPSSPALTSFAANLLDVEESRITPQSTITVAGVEAGDIPASKQGIRREIWIYLLLAAAIITALEWATYHRRWTV